MVAGSTRRSAPAESGCGWRRPSVRGGATDREVAERFRVTRMSANR
jgi:hypothetical protein